MKGFVGYFDILGFSELLRTLEDQAFEKRFKKYCGILKEATSRNDRNLEYTFSSDSVVINSKSGTLSDLLQISTTISEIMYELTMELRVVICGCISYGTFTKRSDNGNTMIAGTPILDAIRYEKRQNWAGVMLSPKIFENFKQIKELLEMDPPGPDVVGQINTNIRWLSTIQKYSEIPFSDGDFIGYAILPRNKESKTIISIIEDYKGFIDRLQELLLYAPDIYPQRKYEKTCGFLNRIYDRWGLKTGSEAYESLIEVEIE